MDRHPVGMYMYTSISILGRYIYYKDRSQYPADLSFDISLVSLDDGLIIRFIISQGSGMFIRSV